jgi:hypothetical protein
MDEYSGGRMFGYAEETEQPRPRDPECRPAPWLDPRSQQAPVDDKSSPAVPVPPSPATRAIHHEYEFRPKPYNRGGGRKPPVQELLHWIQRRNKSVISLRDVCIFGPNAIRQREAALKHIEILVQHGWLIPLRAHRHDRQVWRLPPPGETVPSSEPSSGL